MLKKIKYFQEVVRLNSFSKAADECYISQSAISQQIRALENELGVTLIRRENRSFTLTPAGKYFYNQSLILTEEYEKICRETVKIANKINFSLSVGYLRNYGGTELQRAVASFTSEYRDIPVEIKTGNHEELFEMLRSDCVDIVLSDQRRAFSDEYVNFTLSETDCHIEVSSRESVSSFSHINVDEIKNIPCILVASKDQRKTEENFYREVYGISGEFIFAENIDEARLMVISGKGFLPVEGGKPPDELKKTISCLPLYRKGKPIRRNYCAFWKSDNSGYYIEEFAGSLKKEFEK